MSNLAITRIIHSLHGIATRNKVAPIYIEVYFQRRRIYFNTGIKVKKDQFRNDKVCNCGQQLEYNKRIDIIRNTVLDYINTKMENKEAFSLEGLKEYMSNNNAASKKDSFLSFMYKRIYERKVSEGTRKGHLSVFNTLKKWGKIRDFSDITRANILLWNDLSVTNAVKSKSIHNYHKVLKIYIREAKLFGYVNDNPYDVFHFKRYESTDRRFLTIEELELFKSVKLTETTLIKARDCFLFQCYTGLAYVDMCNFDFESMAKKVDGAYRVKNERIKTGNKYNITLLPSAMDILEKYEYRLPIQTMQVYNRNLQTIQYRAGIEKHISSHVGRHTFATVCLNNKIPIEVVKEFMGHTDIKTTAIYAKILDETANREFDKLRNVF